jgi:hypothetical protein
LRVAIPDVKNLHDSYSLCSAGVPPAVRRPSWPPLLHDYVDSSSNTISESAAPAGTMG